MSVIRQGLESADLDVPVVLPTLNLDFANSQSLDRRITFTRGSTATRVNRNGLIETVGVNQPRFDFDPISGECKGLLIEEQRTNVVTNSTATAFTGLQGLSTTTDGTQAPDGSNAIVYIPTTGATYHATSGVFANINLDTIGIATGATYDVTYSMWIKDYNSSDLGVYFVAQATISGTSPSYALRIAKPKSASWTGGGGQGAAWSINYEKVVPYPNGWYRFIRSYRYTRQTSYNTLDFYFQIFNNRNAQFYNGDGVSGIYMWGPQVETAVSPSQAPFETSYIPTSGSTVTRSADNASMTGTNFSSWYNQSEGTVFCSFETDGISGNPRTFQLTGNNQDERLDHRIVGNVNGSEYYTGSINFGRISDNGVTDPSQGKITVSQNSRSRQFCMNGRTVKSATIPNAPAVNALNIGNYNLQATYLNGTIKKLAYYPKALLPAQLQYLTQ